MSENKLTKKGIEAALDKLDTKLDGIEVKISDIDKTLVRNTDSLAEHMRRSDLLEKNHEELKEVVKPLLRAYTGFWAAAKIVSGLALVTSLLAGLIKLFHPQ